MEKIGVSSFARQQKIRVLLAAEHYDYELHELRSLWSAALGRGVDVDVYLPPGFARQRWGRRYRTLFFNDGQDMPAARLAETLARLSAQGDIHPIIVVALHAGDRMQEYGTALQPDYAQRGSRAGAYLQFVLHELLPFVERRYPISRRAARRAFAGFSLGGLSAMDIVWNAPRHFKKVGVFSGSFWWRSQPYRPEDPDADLIMPSQITLSKKRRGLQFWLQAGTRDEDSDRNNNGIIDAIDDTLHVRRTLLGKGYAPQHVAYREVPGGEHNHGTWAEVLPEFLRWAFGRKK